MSEQIKQDVCPTEVVRTVYISDKRGVEKRTIEEGHSLVDFGVGKDARVDYRHRQVSPLSYDRVMVFNERGANVTDGALGENLVVEGIDFRNLPVSTRLYAGDVRLEMTQIGKECHSHCVIYKRMGECIIPKEGVFARVIREGTIRPRDVMRVEPPAEERPFTAAVITLNDKGARGERKDENGPATKEMLEAAGYEVVEPLPLPDKPGQLKTQFIRLVDSRQAGLVLVSGRTGLSLRNQTPEATMAVAERSAPGVVEFIRVRSVEVTDRAMLSRDVSVIQGTTLVMNLSGGLKAVRESLNFILESLDYGLKILRGSASKCVKR